jgi:hypothetical protein
VPKKLDPRKKQRYIALRKQGWKQGQAAEEVGMSRQTAHRLDLLLPPGVVSSGHLEDDRVPDPIPYDQLNPEAKRAFDDFSFFSERYLCREPVPWRQQAADLLVAALDSPSKDFFGICAPSGAGKTSLELDVALWALIRNRSLRVLLGAEVLDVSKSYLRFLKDRMTSLVPYYDRFTGRTADGVIPLDFGRLRPSSAMGDEVMWTADSIIVAQLGGTDVWNKEPSVQIASRDSGFLGSRFDLELWDDLVTLRTYKDSTLPSWWTRESESRLEPGGVLALIGTRVGPDDLFEFNFGRMFEDDTGVVHPKYHQIVFPAHDDEVCNGQHDGRCLLDPKRLPWAELVGHRDDAHYSTLFMQDPSGDRSGLIEKVWITGGSDEDGQEFAGCLEPDRALGEVPHVPGLIVYATVDPAISTGQWGVMVWGSTPLADGERFLIDGVRKPMRADDFLRVDGSGSLSGFMLDLQRQYQPRTWVIEANLGRLPAFESVSFKLYNISVVWPRTTRANKPSIEVLLPPLFRSSRVHLPFRDDVSKAFVRQFMAELVAFPRGRTTSDLVISMWLGESNIRSILAKGSQQGRALPNIAHGGHYDSRYHRQESATQNPDPAWHQTRGHSFWICSGCNHEHWCIACQGYPLCPTACDCDRQGRFVGQTLKPAPRAERVTIGLGEYGRPSQIAEIATGGYNDDGTRP